MSDTQTASTARHHTTPGVSQRHERMAKAFSMAIQRWAPRRNPYEVFRAFTEMAAITIHQSPYHAGMRDKDDAFDRMERAYRDAIKPYSQDELDGLARLYGAATLALSSCPAPDLLGRVFMELDLNNQYSGQYFTPSGVARMMAAMSLHDARSIIDEQGFITVGEPACGSGCMLIELANELNELGYNPQQVMIFQATDISRDCFNMAYLQLSLMSIPGVVVHGDTLRMEEWERRATPMFAMMHRAGIIEADETAVPTVPTPIADSIQTSPDIWIPGEQISFGF